VRRTLLAVAILVVLIPACGDTARPEGIVERWLVSLNQGAAGEPSVYAAGGATDQLAADWRTREPGAYDEIHVGAARASDGEVQVPFRVVLTDGKSVGGLAIVQAGVVRELREPPPGGADPMLEGVAWDTTAPGSAWIAALGAGLVLGAASLITLAAVRRRAAAAGNPS
jgi:hypothetical protein